MTSAKTKGGAILVLALGLLVILPILPAQAYDGEDIAADFPQALSVALDDIAAYEASHAAHVQRASLSGAGGGGGQVCDIKLLANYGYPEVVKGTGLTEHTVYAHDVASSDIPCFSFDTFSTYPIEARVWFEYWDRSEGRYKPIPFTTQPCSMSSVAGVGALPCPNDQVYNRAIDYPDGKPAVWINAIHRSCFDLLTPEDAADDLEVACSKPWSSVDKDVKFRTVPDVSATTEPSVP